MKATPSTTNQPDKISQPDRVFWGAIALGTALTIVGLGALAWLNLGLTEGRLILSAGLGILLGAFGSTATVKYKGVTMTGVAASTIILFYTVVKLTDSQITYGYIKGDVEGAIIEIVADDTYLGTYRTRTRRYDFMIPGDHLETSPLLWPRPCKTGPCCAVDGQAAKFQSRICVAMPMFSSGCKTGCSSQARPDRLLDSPIPEVRIVENRRGPCRLPSHKALRVPIYPSARCRLPSKKATPRFHIS